MLEVLHARERNHQWVPAASMVLTTLALHQNQQVLAWLRKGVDDHTVTLFEVNTDPLYSELKDDPEYRTIITRLGG